MRVAQITLRHATEYEKKCRRVDRAALAAEHEIVESPRGADVVHVYGAGVRRPRFWSRVVPVTPLKDAQQTFISEAIEEQYFAQNTPAGTGVGVYVRRSVKALIEQTQHRLHRTRDDVAWHLFDRVPTPGDLAQVAVWLDPAVADDDFDGFVAEALAAGRIVVASRTPINVQRLEKGRTGFLVPPDANEMTHAILTALFKPEVGRPRVDAARQTISKFQPRQRLRALVALYERLRS